MEKLDMNFKVTDFEVTEISSCTIQEFTEIALLMKVLSPGYILDMATLNEVLTDPASHLYVMRHTVGTDPGPNITVSDSCGSPLAPGRIVGCCTICTYTSPTGLKATVEDVVLHNVFQGYGLGRLLVESSLWQFRSLISNKARSEGFVMKPQEVHQDAFKFNWQKKELHSQPVIHVQLTSKPKREAANALYKSLGFSRI